MTKRFEEAVERVKELPDEDQDLAAELLLMVANADSSQYRLSAAQVEEVKRIQQAVREGTATFVSDDDMAAFWKKFGL
jgi:hypothetical protein